MFRILHTLFVFLLLLAVPTVKADEKDMLYEYRIEQLNRLSPVPLDYNAEVRKYIDIFTGPRKADMAKVIGRSGLYFPLFDEIFDRHNLPYELKYLTIVESGLDPLAVSKSGAVGLWQFLLNTGRLFDLTINSYIDERRDVYKSTEAACRYLQYLNNTFHDWHLVLSSYNGGPGEVRKAIEKCNGETSYWKIRPYLSEQAQNYVPAFIAAFYLIHYYQQHGIEPICPSFTYNNLDTLHIRYAVSFEQIASVIAMPVDSIRLLNPVYRYDYIPAQEPFSILVLPQERVLRYLRNEINILGYTSSQTTYTTMLQQAGSTTGRRRIVHEVQSGEYIHRIAIKYNCTLENIRAWNNLPDYDIKAGQKLVIWIK